MFILKKGHQPGVYVPLRALFLVSSCSCADWLVSNMVRNFESTFSRKRAHITTNHGILLCFM